MTEPDTLYDWPLMVDIEDCYIPQSAPHVISAVAGLDDESAAVTLKLAAMAAWWQVEGN